VRCVASVVPGAPIPCVGGTKPMAIESPCVQLPRHGDSITRLTCVGGTKPEASACISARTSGAAALLRPRPSPSGPSGGWRCGGGWRCCSRCRRAEATFGLGDPAMVSHALGEGGPCWLRPATLMETSY
jgi:hypothetical protein